MVPVAFRNLNEEQYQMLLDAVPNIVVLIAGADGKIDLKDKKFAEKIIGIRTYSNHFEVKPFYQELDKNYKNKIEDLITSLPEDTKKRNEQISKYLSIVNAVIAKLPLRLAAQMYSSYLSLAEHVAKASGGILGMMAVNVDENEWVGLPMLDPVFYDEYEEE